MLRVRVAGPDGVAARLRDLGAGALDVVDRPDVALVVAVPGADPDADVTLSADAPLDRQLSGLVTERLLPWASALAAGRFASGPAVLVPHDQAWPVTAARRLTRVRAALTPFTSASSAGWAYEHIGSTAVPGLPAKPFLDLQVQVPALPDPATLDAAMARAGLVAATGSRPDSPGVHRDEPRGSEPVPDDVWRKRLFVLPDPAAPGILHVRLAASPWGRHTVQFRDWLRAHPAERAHYARLKATLAAAHRQDPDYDDYTRAKSSWITEVLPRFEAWSGGTTGEDPPGLV